MSRVEPLTDAQHRMWLFANFLPKITPTNAPITVRLKGSLCVPAVRTAFDRLAARHESLRTRFPADDVVPVQLIEDPSAVPLRVVDIASVPERLRDRALDGALAAAATRPSNLDSGPLWHAMVVSLDQDDHVLIITLHHLIADLWSVALVIDELSTSYRTSLAGLPCALPPVRAHQADIEARRRERLTPQRLAQRKQWWRARLDGLCAVDLPSDRPRQAKPNPTTHVCESRLSAALSEDLRGLSRAEGATLYSTILGGLACLIANWSGQTDFAVVSATAGRYGRDHERVIGSPIECLIMRVNTDGDPSFRELLAKTSESVLDAFDHIVPYCELVSIVDPSRRRQPAPLRQLGFTLHNALRVIPSLPGIELGAMPPAPHGQSGFSEADLWLEVFDSGAGPLGVRLQLDDQLFEPSSAARVGQALTRLLATAVREPELRLSQLAPADLPGSKLGPAVPLTAWPQPAQATVHAVASVIADMLDIPIPRPEDNFFLLGGSSIDAVRLASMLSDRFDARLRLLDVVFAPTVEGLAAELEQEITDRGQA